jgi:hypothetical protein
MTTFATFHATTSPESTAYGLVPAAADSGSRSRKPSGKVLADWDLSPPVMVIWRGNSETEPDGG